ncbi:hypothetical protein [Alteripontixanthobacter muriae]|uniref:hypothetical protein n=1 Tax=Alteripontixanthobacter muriae TaxID=2705546 RepID=UPI001575ED2A|nr:hypothetical protein [Alteripontixanthobacter muriae]
MQSGRYSDTPGNRIDPIYWGGATVDKGAATWPLLHPPGIIFRYAKNDTLMAVEAIAPPFAAHPPAELSGRLGMQTTVSETDWQGNYILSSHDLVHDMRSGPVGPALPAGRGLESNAYSA